MITVAMVEDDAGDAAGVQQLLNGSGRFQCVALCPTAEEALACLPALKPDVVLMDIELPQATGVECVRQLRPLVPETQILMLTVFQDNDHIFQALRAGASGYLCKPDKPAMLLDAIEELHHGGSPMSAAIARKVVASFREPDDLSEREREVLERLAQGRRDKEVAADFGLSVLTVRKHLQHIYRKLAVHSRAQAVRKLRGPGRPA